MLRLRTLLVVAAAWMGSNVAQADVLTFRFTGRISDTILQSGIQQQAETHIPDSWLGQAVSGTFSMDLTGMEPRILEPGYSQLAKTADRPRSDWLTVTVNQPDGSTLVIPSGPVRDIDLLPGFCPECDDAYSHITNQWVPSWDPGASPRDSFYAQRTLNNDVAPFPRQSFQINLSGNGPEADRLVDSIDYRQATFDASLANWDNHGYVTDSPSAGHQTVYAFTVLSLTSHVSAVPEPGALLMAGAGALGLLLARRRHVSTRGPWTRRSGRNVAACTADGTHRTQLGERM